MQTNTDTMKAIASGNIAALELLYEEFAPTIYGLAIRITESRDKAADVVIEVFRRLWRNASSFDPFQNDLLSFITDLVKEVAFANETRSDQFDFFAYQQSNSTGYDLKDVLSRIDSKHRQILELSFFRNLSEEQIEEEMNIPIGTVATRLRLAIKAMRETLE